MAKRLSLAVGLMLIAVAIGIVMSRPPLVLARTNAVPIDATFAVLSKPSEVCQAHEVLPAGTTAIRVSLDAMLGPPVHLRVLHDGEVLASGEQTAGWTHFATVPVKALKRTVAGVRVCAALVPKQEAVSVDGVLQAGARAGGRFRIEYLRSGDRSWWALAPSIAKRMSFGRATEGIWIVIALLAAMAALIAIVAVGMLRPARVAVWVALAAAINAACWSVVTPPFQVTDEAAHFAYVKQLAESGRPPRGVTGAMPEEESVAFTYLHVEQIIGEPGRHTIASSSEQSLLRRELAAAERLPREGSENAGVATAEPPLYYAAEAIPYLIAYHGSLLERLQLMQLLSALMAGFTALFAFLFVREALPAESWAWTIAGLGVAVTPLLGFMSGAVNPDAMLFAVSAALFFCIARAFRRGLTRKLAGGIGAVIAVGLLTKLNFVALVPGALVALTILSRRVARTARREAARRLAIAGAIAIAPILVAIVAGELRSHGGPRKLTANVVHFVNQGSLAAKLDYGWQLYLPRLPGMVNDFPYISTARQIWFNGFVGLYGWSQVAFPNWVYDLALIPAAVIIGLFIRALYRRRPTLRRRRAEICVYALMSVGVMAMIAAASYRSFPAEYAYFARVRYLLPMLALFGALLALAARGAGRRWGPVVGIVIVLFVLADDIFSQLLVVGHYYG